MKISVNAHEELLEAAKKAKTLTDILVKLYPDGHEHDLSFTLADGTFSDCIWCDAVKIKITLTQAITKAEQSSNPRSGEGQI